eukprot:2797080-Rhodomonas_salina.1
MIAKCPVCEYRTWRRERVGGSQKRDQDRTWHRKCRGEHREFVGGQREDGTFLRALPPPGSSIQPLLA